MCDYLLDILVGNVNIYIYTMFVCVYQCVPRSEVWKYTAAPSHVRDGPQKSLW